MNTLLSIRGLTVSYRKGKDKFLALDEVSLDIGEGEVFGIAGESGSGKSTLALAILGMLPFLGAEISGEISFQGRAIGELSEKDLRRIRGKEISLVSQNPWGTLDPLYRVGYQLEEFVMAHTALGRKERRELVQQALIDSQLPGDEAFMKLYPHQLSGGMLQRISIAMGTALSPQLLVADEPTSSLDVTTQAEIVRLLKKMRLKKNTSIVFISHDLALLSQICDKIAIIKRGRIVESGSTREIFTNPQNAYTKSLIEAIPKVEL